MDAPAIAKVAFTSEDRVRDVIRNFNADGFDSLYPKYKGGHPPKFTLPQRREIKKIARAKPMGPCGAAKPGAAHVDHEGPVARCSRRSGMGRPPRNACTRPYQLVPQPAA
jgi:hypothetical protein